MDIEKVKEFIKILEASDLKKLTIKEKDSELVLEKEDVHTHHSVHMPAPHHMQHPSPTSFPSVKQSVQTEGSYVSSPMVGTFYSKPAPDHKDFVKVGDRVEKDTIVCIIEAMKVMNEVKADASGRIEEILIEDGHPVEYGTKLFRIV